MPVAAAELASGVENGAVLREHAERSDQLLKGIVGKRLTYRRTAALAA